ncbi:MAG: cupredoxin domain-containing protein [Actinomycetota bacterium]
MKPYALVAGAVATILLGACSSSTSPGAASSAPPASVSAAAGLNAIGGIVIRGFAYSGTMTVKPGQKVTVTNQDTVAHTLTDKQTHLFDTGNIAGGGERGTFTAPTKPGSYPLACTYHPAMKGTLVVK